jgi:hypothetical protein
MAALEKITKNDVDNARENQLNVSLKRRVASFLADIPEPAAQSAALQLLKSKFVLDRSFVFCMGIIVMAIIEELL